MEHERSGSDRARFGAIARRWVILASLLVLSGIAAVLAVLVSGEREASPALGTRAQRPEERETQPLDRLGARPAYQYKAYYPSVPAAADWLVLQQDADGSWSGVEGGLDDVAVTATAVEGLFRGSLAFGRTDWERSLQRAVDYLLGTQRPDGSFADRTHSNLLAVSSLAQVCVREDDFVVPDAKPRGTRILGADRWQRVQEAIKEGAKFIVGSNEDDTWADDPLVPVHGYLALLKINCLIDLRYLNSREINSTVNPTLRRALENLTKRFPDSVLADGRAVERLGPVTASLVVLTFLRAGWKREDFATWQPSLESVSEEGTAVDTLAFRYLSELSRRYLFDQRTLGAGQFGRWAARLQTRTDEAEGSWETRGVLAGKAGRVFATATMLYCMRLAPGRCTGW